jgi:putative PIN family toxin of toxin-antitoxin system
MSDPLKRIVVDTGVLISRLLTPRSVAATAAEEAIRHSTLLFSEQTLAELHQVLSRKKFDRYVEWPARLVFYRWIESRARMVEISGTLRACRDARDDKILEVAQNGGASLILTGDNDLLSMIQWRDIPILNPAAFLARTK